MFTRLQYYIGPIRRALTPLFAKVTNISKNTLLVLAKI
jgi:hypothetical protein